MEPESQPKFINSKQVYSRMLEAKEEERMFLQQNFYNVQKEQKVVEEQVSQFSDDLATQYKEEKPTRTTLQSAQFGNSEKILGNSDDVIKAGYLEREVGSFFSPWLSCFCVLSRSKLMIFEDESRINLMTCLNFQKVKCQLHSNDDSSTSFTFVYGEDQSSITLRTQQLQQKQLWVHDILSVIKSFINKPKLRIRKGSIQHYQDKAFLTEQEFFQAAQTGDILLMKTSDSKCALQRFVTNSEYDHIGMAVKFPSGQVKIFEANADEGVQLYGWQQFHQRFNHYEKVCYKKLYHKNKEGFHTMLVPFIKQMIGKVYSFGAMKLFRKKSDEENGSIQEDYFCSELVAKAYKHLGLLDNKKGSNSYWPVDFTDRGAIDLQQESYFGFERLILLKKHLK